MRNHLRPSVTDALAICVLIVTTVIVATLICQN